MKISKKVLLITAAPLIALGIGGAVFALKPDEPKKVSAKQATAITQPTVGSESTDTAETPPAQQQTTASVQQAQTAPAQVVDPVQALKDEVAQKVRQRAIDNGVTDPQYEVSCMDTRINQEGGYTQSVVDDALKVYLGQAVHFEGTCRMIFD